MKTKNQPVTIAKMERPAILALTRKLLDAATHRLASGQDVTQENIKIVNRARKLTAPK